MILPENTAYGRLVKLSLCCVHKVSLTISSQLKAKPIG
jgi:hypothetical protein